MKKSKLIVSILLIVLLLLFIFFQTTTYYLSIRHGIFEIDSFNATFNVFTTIFVYFIRRLIRYGILILFLVLNLFLKDKKKMIFSAILGCVMILMIGFNTISTLISYYQVFENPRLFLFELNEFASILIMASIVVYIFNSIPNGSVLFFVNTILNISLIIAKILFMIVILFTSSGGAFVFNRAYSIIFVLLLITIDVLFIFYFWKNE